MATLPDGPRASPLAQTVLYHRDPLGVVRRARARHGPLFTLRMVLKDPLVVAGAPAAVAQLLDADPARAHAGETRRAVLPLASERSPFGADGAQHRASRGRMAAGFSEAAIARVEPAIAELAERRVSGWPVGRPFRLLARMRTLATEVFVREVLAVRDDGRATALVAAMRRLLWTPGNPPTGVPGAGDGPLGAAVVAEFERRMAAVERLLGAEVQERRASGELGDDVLGGMLAATPPLAVREVADELLVVLAAAQEPPSIALTNVVLELARAPELADAFVEASPAEPLRDAVVREVMRLRPPAQAVLRRLVEPATVAGVALDAGTHVALHSLLLHRAPEVWDAPDELRWERFARGVPDGVPYLPFGGGARRCIGEPLSWALFRAALPVVLRHLRFSAVTARPERMVVRGTVLVPHRSALVVAHRR
ncbi:cytochrome P450 [Conexibacter sp. SYSU D00693]|uniref:cytochrome P450 n=1 Tax=Conexibacter sp. SYSU D00693 TaxID=2812560 RepID=UPI00196B5381|nr:cytochrome P450 [Conexibacter sp. SYSU D00693]